MPEKQICKNCGREKGLHAMGKHCYCATNDLRIFEPQLLCRWCGKPKEEHHFYESRGLFCYPQYNDIFMNPPQMFEPVPQAEKKGDYMNTIKFSHDYEKLPIDWKGTDAQLWAVVFIPDMEKLKNRMPQFINMDTKIRGKDEYYHIDFKEGLVLFFTHMNTGITFTTIRRSTPDKRSYYEKETGTMFILKEVS